MDVETLLDNAMDAVTDDAMMGFCVECGAEHYNVEPDARHYRCTECGALTVYGAEEIIVMYGGV